MTILLLVVYLLACGSLLIYGLNCYVLLGLFMRRRTTLVGDPVRPENSEDWPLVATQIPLYNEANVARRLIDAVAGFSYPENKHEIQILDDSDDDTRAVVDEAVTYWQARGKRIAVIRRTQRTGYKAGALREGMEQSQAEFFAVFDADFVPPPDFLLRLVPHFLQDPGIGLVQSRWGHLNRDDSLLTRAQSLGIDGHFMIEQGARAGNGLYLNFNGTAGLWRRAAIEDAGGWQDDTLTEDLDLSYRAQLVGWRACYRPDVVSPAELPTSIAAFKSQQHRWAKGSIQTAKKILPRLWREPGKPWRKIQATLHLTHYGIHPLMLVLALTALPVTLAFPDRWSFFWFGLTAIALAIGMMAPSTLYLASQRCLYPDWIRRIAWLPVLMMVGVGLAVSNTRAVFEGITGHKSGFIRTPKRGDRAEVSYRVKAPVMPLLELALGIYCTLSLAAYLTAGNLVIGPFLAIYASGFLFVGLLGLTEAAGEFRRRRFPAPKPSVA